MPKHLTYIKGVVYFPVMLSAIGLSDPNPMTENSNVQLVAGAKSIIFELIGTGITTRSAVFTITVSMDGGITFRAYSMMISNATNANTESLTRVASVTRNATGIDILWMTPETLAGITHIKTHLVITDSGTPAGTFTVKAAIAY